MSKSDSVYGSDFTVSFQTLVVGEEIRKQLAQNLVPLSAHSHGPLRCHVFGDVFELKNAHVCLQLLLNYKV